MAEPFDEWPFKRATLVRVKGGDPRSLAHVYWCRRGLSNGLWEVQCLRAHTHSSWFTANTFELEPVNAIDALAELVTDG